MSKISPSKPIQPRGRPTWQVLYHALGAFSVLSVLSAVALNTAVLNTYKDSVGAAQTWAGRSAQFSGISRLATIGNAPGNDVFENKDIAGESAKLAATSAEFDAAADAAEASLRAELTPEEAAPLLADLSAARESFHAMEASANEIFAAFSRDDTEAAGAAMAQMDRRLGETSARIGALSDQAQVRQDELFATELGRADRLQHGAFGLVGLVALMVTGVVVYGQRLAEMFARSEAEIARRRGEVMLLLDNVDQGLVTVDAAGAMSTERSAAFGALFGAPVASGRFADQLAAIDPAAATWFDITFEGLHEGLMPDEVLLTQLPQGFVNNEQHVALSYQVLREDGALKGVLVIASDVTAAVRREAAEATQRQTMALFDRINQDRLSVVEFIAETDRAVRTIAAETADLATEKRLLHTIKGNSGFYGLNVIVEVSHALEAYMDETGEPLDTAGRARLSAAWDEVRVTAQRLLGEGNEDKLIVEDTDLQALLVAVLARRPHAEIARSIAALKLEPVERRFDRIAEQARSLGVRLGKGDVEVEVDTGGLRGDPERTAAFWGSLVHVVRNAVDHGYEPTAARLEQGKPAAMQLSLRATEHDNSVRIEIADDGAGIDWARLQAKAIAADPRLAEAELHELLFMDGLSSRDEATELSGRGVGMGAVRAEVEQLGGAVSVRSAPGRGTAFTFEIPSSAWAADPMAAAS